MLDYREMVKTALRGVLRDALAQVAEHGIEGSHHFYISFHTDHPEAVLPAHLKAVYPQEMTIVLEHQFWDLEVDDEAFRVTLAFGGERLRLIVPFAAVTAFVDPGAQFGLQFESASEDVPSSENGLDAAALEASRVHAGQGANQPDDGGKVLRSNRFRVGQGDDGGSD